jgi:hypothetical protein
MQLVHDQKKKGDDDDDDDNDNDCKIEEDS